MRLQVMAREGFLHKGEGGCYRFNTGRGRGALLQVDLLALAQGAPRVRDRQVGLHRVLADHRLVAEKVVLGGGKGGGGRVRWVIHQVALHHCLRCLSLKHLSLKICMATVHLVASGWVATFEEAVAGEEASKEGEEGRGDTGEGEGPLGVLPRHHPWHAQPIVLLLVVHLHVQVVRQARGQTGVGGACPSSASCVEALGQVLQQGGGVSGAPTVGGTLVVSDVPGTGGVLQSQHSAQERRLALWHRATGTDLTSWSLSTTSLEPFPSSLATCRGNTCSSSTRWVLPLCEASLRTRPLVVPTNRRSAVSPPAAATDGSTAIAVNLSCGLVLM